MPLASVNSEPIPSPTLMAELAPGERLVVLGLRRWVLGLRENAGEHWSWVWNEFARELGTREGREALTAFAAMIKAMQAHARRTIYHHHPCCPCLGADERAVMGFVAACQHGAARRARDLAEGMVSREGAGEFVGAGARLARAMGRGGLSLPRRGVEAGSQATLEPRTGRSEAVH